MGRVVLVALGLLLAGTVSVADVKPEKYRLLRWDQFQALSFPDQVDYLRWLRATVVELENYQVYRGKKVALHTPSLELFHEFLVGKAFAEGPDAQPGDPCHYAGNAMKVTDVKFKEGDPEVQQNRNLLGKYRCKTPESGPDCAQGMVPCQPLLWGKTCAPRGQPAVKECVNRWDTKKDPELVESLRDFKKRDEFNGYSKWVETQGCRDGRRYDKGNCEILTGRIGKLKRDIKAADDLLRQKPPAPVAEAPAGDSAAQPTTPTPPQTATPPKDREWTKVDDEVVPDCKRNNTPCPGDPPAEPVEQYGAPNTLCENEMYPGKLKYPCGTCTASTMVNTVRKAKNQPTDFHASDNWMALLEIMSHRCKLQGVNRTPEELRAIFGICDKKSYFPYQSKETVTNNLVAVWQTGKGMERLKKIDWNITAVAKTREIFYNQFGIEYMTADDLFCSKGDGTQSRENFKSRLSHYAGILNPANDQYHKDLKVKLGKYGGAEMSFAKCAGEAMQIQAELQGKCADVPVAKDQIGKYVNRTNPPRHAMPVISRGRMGCYSVVGQSAKDQYWVLDGQGGVYRENYLDAIFANEATATVANCDGIESGAAGPPSSAPASVESTK
jgi:hypothetical protein